MYRKCCPLLLSSSSLSFLGNGSVSPGSCVSVVPWNHLACRTLTNVPKIRQKHRHLFKIVTPKQENYKPKPADYCPLPKSLAISGPFRSLFRSKSQNALDILKQLDLKPYACNEPGVRWHPGGGFWVQYNKRRHDKNFAVNCGVLFRTCYFGFEGAKRAAIAFRRRLQAEWKELEDQWARIDEENARKDCGNRDTLRPAHRRTEMPPYLKQPRKKVVQKAAASRSR